MSSNEETETRQVPVFVQVKRSRQRKLSIESEVDASESDNSGASNDHLQVEPGENWLRIVKRDANALSVLDETQDQLDPSLPNEILFVSILDKISAAESNVVVDEECYLIIDYDEQFPAVAIKDMRRIEDKDISTSYELCLARRTITKSENEKDVTQTNDDNIWAGYDEGLESLPRRQLRILQVGDRLCTKPYSDTDREDEEDNNNEFESVGIILELRMVTAMRKKDKKQTQSERDDDDENSNDSTREGRPSTSLVVLENSSSDAEDGLQTQSNNFSLKLAQSDSNSESSEKTGESHKKQGSLSPATQPDIEQNSESGSVNENPGEQLKESVPAGGGFLTQETEPETTIWKESEEKEEKANEDNDDGDDATTIAEDNDGEKAPAPTIIKDHEMENPLNKNNGDGATTIREETDQKKDPTSNEEDKADVDYEEDDDATTIGEDKDEEKVPEPTIIKNDEIPANDDDDDDDDVTTIGEEGSTKKKPRDSRMGNKADDDNEEDNDATTIDEDKDKDTAADPTPIKGNVPADKKSPKKTANQRKSGEKRKESVSDPLSDEILPDKTTNTRRQSTRGQAKHKSEAEETPSPEDVNDNQNDPFPTVSSKRKYNTYSSRDRRSASRSPGNQTNDPTVTSPASTGRRSEKSEDGAPTTTKAPTSGVMSAKSGVMSANESDVASDDDTKTALQDLAEPSQRTRSVAEAMVGMGHEASEQVKEPEEPDTKMARLQTKNNSLPDESPGKKNTAVSPPDQEEQKDLKSKGSKQKSKSPARVKIAKQSALEDPEYFSQFVPKKDSIFNASPTKAEEADPTAEGRKRRRGKRGIKEKSPVKEPTNNEDEVSEKNVEPQEEEKEAAEEPEQAEEKLETGEEIEDEKADTAEESSDKPVRKKDPPKRPGRKKEQPASEKGGEETLAKRRGRMKDVNQLVATEDPETPTSKRGRKSKSPTIAEPETTSAKGRSKRKATKAKTENANKRAKRDDEEGHNQDEEEGDHVESRDDPGQIIITNSGVELTNKHLSAIQKLGWTYTESVMNSHCATHIIAGDKRGKKHLKRTPKMMVAMCTTRNILDLEWLTESLKAKKALHVDKYLINDKEAEEKYGFSMQTSLDKAAKMRAAGAGVLTGWTVLVCAKVAGNSAPKQEELKLMVEQAGGTWQTKATKKALADIDDLSRLLIITSDPPTTTQLTSAIKDAISKGAKQRTPSFLFDCLMRQEISLQE